ncbi:unnamed protein product [Brassicogethes aeneus]|uniref:Peptidase S1 domain-containing protein n=1 Tax=Brassicogethes aeneus TaxID=1431903 RepID=A0A9P0B149_BRAAE|nr:unnamed protein product [Brassicogethes aeneus]CAH0553084.1 unnamed protein product [Brassicogethes aeneus]
MKTCLALLSFVALSFGAPKLPNVFPIPDGRIVGGDSVDIKDYPYQVSVQISNEHDCGGTIVGNKWIVTAAHCTVEYTRYVGMVSIRAGSSKLERAGQVVKVKKIYIHPKYDDSTTDYDISILELKNEITIENAKPIPLAPAKSYVAPGSIATITGWGDTQEYGNLANVLQMVQIPIVSTEACKQAYGEDITERMICAGYTEGGKDSCQGDSGGPLVINGTLTGVVSWGNGCALPESPGVYSSIPALRTWVDSVINK